MRRLYRLLLLLVLIAGPSAAAPPVEHPRGTPGITGFSPAAKLLGVDDWGDGEQFNHVLLSATRDTATLWIAVAPDVSEERAGAYLLEVADQLRWPAPRLAIYPRSEALVLKLESTGAPAALFPGQSRLTVDLPRLVGGLRRLSNKPVLLAVRTPGIIADQRTPEPTVAGARRGDGDLFYRLPTNGGSTLRVDYGVPPRWPAAALVSMLLWLLFPMLPALAMRHYVSTAALQPVERLRFFDRCQAGVRLVAAVGFYITFSSLQLERTRYFGFNPWLGIPPALTLLLPYWFWCGGMIGLVRRGLSRKIAAAGLVVRNNPFLEFSYALILIGIVLGPGLVVSQFGPRAGLRAIPVVTAAAMALIGVVMLGVFAPRLLRKPQRILDISFDTLPDDPELLRVLLRERTEEVNRNLDAPTPNAKLTAAWAEAVAVSPIAQAVLALDADQQVALSASYHLIQRRVVPLHRTQCTFFLGALVLLIAVSLWCCFHPLPGMGGVLLPLSFPLLLGSNKQVTTFFDHRITRHCLAADLRITQALDQPRRFLEALRLLEQAENAMYATVGVGQAAGTGFAERRKRLEQHLGLA